MLSCILDACWTDKQSNVTIDTPEMIEGLTRWKTVCDEGLTPCGMSSGEIRKLFADGKMALRLNGPRLYGTEKKEAAADILKVAVPALSPPVGGSSNVLGMAADIPDDKKTARLGFH